MKMFVRRSHPEGCLVLYAGHLTRVEKEMTKLFERFAEIGRVVLVNYGPDNGKLGTVIDIVDGNKALLDGPTEITGLNRQVVPFKRVWLTDFKVRVPRNARTKTLKKAWEAAKVKTRWEESTWAKKLAAKARKASLTDFDRYKVMVAKQKRAAIIKKHL